MEGGGRAREGGKMKRAFPFHPFSCVFSFFPLNQCFVDYCEGPQYRFCGIRDFASLKLGFRDFKAKPGRYSGLNEK